MRCPDFDRYAVAESYIDLDPAAHRLAAADANTAADRSADADPHSSSACPVDKVGFLPMLLLDLAA